MHSQVNPNLASLPRPRSPLAEMLEPPLAPVNKAVSGTRLSLQDATPPPGFGSFDKAGVREVPQHGMAPPSPFEAPALLPKPMDETQQRSPENQAFRPPPGLEILVVADNQAEKLFPPGLFLGGKKSAESDFVNVDSNNYEEIGCVDDDGGHPTTSIGLVLADVSHLKASSPIFCPIFSSTTAAQLMPDLAQKKPARTKLRSKADAYVPAHTPMPHARECLPFIPRASLEGRADMNSEQDGVSSDASTADYHFQDNGIADFYYQQDGMASYGGTDDFYSEQEWW